MTEMVAEVRGVDVVRVSAWLCEHVAGAVAPFEFSPIAGGRSNLTYTVTGADGARFVLRRPPMGHVLATAHDMAREHRIIAAVGRTSVPVAPAMGLCDDLEVNGAPFYVMGYVDGVVLDSPTAGLGLERASRTTASESLIDVLVELHAVEPDVIDLGDLGRREGYLERQLRRWSTQWEKSKTRELPIVEEVHRRLSTGLPPQIHTGIVHGDYRLGNCLVDPSSGSLRAVLDWELCTLGDLLADVGYLLVYWSDEGSASRRENDPSGSPGFLSRAEMLDRYARLSGRDLSSIGYYEAFSCWRLACIAEGVLNRYKAGVMGGEEQDFTSMEAGVGLLAERAMTALEHSRSLG